MTSSPSGEECVWNPEVEARGSRGDRQCRDVVERHRLVARKTVLGSNLSRAVLEAPRRVGKDRLEGEPPAEGSERVVGQVVHRSFRSLNGARTDNVCFHQRQRGPIGHALSTPTVARWVVQRWRCRAPHQAGASGASSRSTSTRGSRRIRAAPVVGALFWIWIWEGSASLRNRPSAISRSSTAPRRPSKVV